MARDWRLGIVLLYAVVTAAAMATMGDPQSLIWYALAIPFMLVAVAPVALLCLLRKWPLTNGIGAAIAAAFGMWAYADTAWGSGSDAQDGLVFLVVPVLQCGFVAAWLGLTALFHRLRTD